MNSFPACVAEPKEWQVSRGIMKKNIIGQWLAVILIGITVLSLRGYCQDVQSTPAQGVKIADGVHYVGNFGCNIAASVGPDGVLIIDSGYKGTMDQVRSALTQVSKEPIRIIMNTHFHFDYVGGNEALARDGALIISQEKARERIAKLIMERKTLEEIVAVDPTAGLFKGGKSWLDPKLFVFCVYMDLVNKPEIFRNANRSSVH